MVQKRQNNKRASPGREAIARFSPEPEPAPRERTRLDMLLMGDLSPADLDKDELRQGRPRGIDGTFRGRPPKVPDAIQAAIKREFHKRLFDEINKHSFDAVETIVDVMHRGEGASAFQGQKDGTKRLDAAKYLLERVIGKIPDKTENTTEITVWQGLNETGGLFVDVDVEEIRDDAQRVLDVGTPGEVVRKAGPRTRRGAPLVDPPEPAAG